MKTAIINNREGLEVCQLPSTQTDRSGRALLGGIVTLLPGLNLVESTQVAELQKNPGFRAKFTQKIEPGMAPEHQLERTGQPILAIVHFERKVDGKPVQVPVDFLDDDTPLAKLSDKECERLVSEALVNEMLNGWTRAETRPSVKFLIENQIKKINAGLGNPATIGR